MFQLWQHIRPGWRRWLLGVLMLACSNAASAAIVELIKAAIDTVQSLARFTGTLGQAARASLATGHVAELKNIAGAMVAVALLGAAFRTASRVFILQAARDAELSLRQRFYCHLTVLDQAFFRTHPPGELMSRATSDLTQVRLLLGPALLNGVSAVVMYGTALPLMMRIDAKLTCVAFLVYPPALLWLRRLLVVNYHRNRAQQEALGKLANTVQENISAAATVRAYAIEPEQVRRFGASNANFLRATLRLLFAGSGIFRVAASLTSLGSLAVALLGAQMVAAGRLSLGDVVAMVEYMALLSGPTIAFGWVLSLWQRGQASLARLDEVLGHVPAITGGSRVLAPGAKPLSVRQVAVDYGSGRGLSDVSFTLAPGQTLGVVGAIGSGKTTLARALLRLLPLSGGSISLGDVPTDALTLASLRRHFSYAPQDAALMSKSIYDNVAFGNPGASEQEVMAALELAGFADEARAMVDGVHTLVGERGVTLSGGQKQRCALARALLVRAPVLLLDDALSAVDTVTEARILTALAERHAEQSTIVIAHRLATVAHADEILLLAGGKVAERGSHEQLVRQQGAYAEMARKQRLSAESEGGRP